MSMDNDTRLAMMHMSNDFHRQPSARPRKNNRSHNRSISALGLALATFALTLFTRSA